MSSRSPILGPTGAPARGITGKGSGSVAAARWWEGITGLDGLRGAYDFREIDGGSVLSKDANQGVVGATDLSAEGNDFVHWRASGHSEIARLGGSAGDNWLDCTGQSDERHFGGNTAANGWGITNGYHLFMVFQCSTALAQASSSSGTAQSGFGFNGAGTSGRPFGKFANIGGSSSAGR